jgi:ribulose-phosphate 3-epimerase
MHMYEILHEKTPLAIHLMVKDPFPIVEKTNEFIQKEERHETTVFIQVESFSSEEETIRSLNLLKEYGYKAGICLDLPTPRRILRPKIIETADTVLLMTVPMGEGGQKYSDKATRRIVYFSRRFPHKIIEVDGGINFQTIVLAQKAGAKIAVVGSFITQNKDPTRAIRELE